MQVKGTDNLLSTIRGGSYERRQILPLMYRLLNRKEYSLRRRLANQFPTGQYTEIPKDVGFVRTQVADMSVVGEVIRDAEQKAKHPDNKQTLQGIYDPLHHESLEQTSLNLESPYLRFCLQDEIIGIVSRYLGEIPILTYIGVWNSSRKYFREDEYLETHFFHCDGDATTQVKIFICVNNVTKESGPLCILDAHQSRIARHRLRYRYHSPKYRVTDDEMERVLPDYSIFECTGDPGTIFIVDSSKCFHYGARIADREHSRVLAWFNFVSVSETLVPKKRKPYPFRSLVTSNLSEVQRLLLGGR